MTDYSISDITAALAELPIALGDVVFGHSNLGFFGRPEGVRDGRELCAVFAEAILERVGPSGALVVPTFTYSFPRQEIFDPDNSASAMGMFSEWVRNHPESHRSVDPCYSVAALGGGALKMVEKVPENSFGDDSFFDRFYKANGKILNLNFDAGSTFIHYVERCLKIPYRFDKTFTGTVCEAGVKHQASSTIWVRYISDDALESAFEGFDLLARQQGVFHTRKLGRGEVGVISACDTYNLLVNTLPERPWLLTKAEKMGVLSPHIEQED